ncbi:MAG: hypothetical protein ACJ76H_01455 [Bacteriovoracaceae bacterium]
MVKVNSSRAKKILETPRFLKKEILPNMRKFPGTGILMWMELEGDQNSVKNLSFSGSLNEFHILVLESMAGLLIGKKISVLDQLTLRECEAYLRDRNSEMAFEGWGPDEEALFQSIFRWVRAWPFKNPSQSYVYSSDKGPFRLLKLADKVREIKAFLSSKEISLLYHNVRAPELIDVDDLTVYVDAPFSSEEERALFHELHERGVEVFHEDELNFIPES